MMYLTELNSSQSSRKSTSHIHNVIELYEYAEEKGYDTYWYSLDLDGLESLSTMRLRDGKCFIAIDPFKLKSDADELVKGLHEIAHCDTGSFYNAYATCDVRAKHEKRADKQSIQLRLSAEDLDAAVADGCTEMWSLAEHFSVTEEFMKKAVCWYVYGNLDVEHYMAF